MARTRSPSLPLGSIIFTAIRHVSPSIKRVGLANGRLERPLNCPKASRSTTPLAPSTRASLSHLERSGKNAWQMQKVRPS